MNILYNFFELHKKLYKNVKLQEVQYEEGSVKRSLVLVFVIVIGGVAAIGIEYLSKTANTDYENAKVEGYVK